MKRISQKMLMAFINKNFFVKEWDSGYGIDDCYYSKIDGSYITHVGMEKDTPKMLLKRGIVEHLQGTAPESVVQIGFNPEERKWYGWSHRAIYGFGIGSTCEKGDCHYTPSTPQELFESVTTPNEDGWAWQKPEMVELLPNGIRITHEMTTLGPKSIVDKCDTIVTMSKAIEGAFVQADAPEPIAPQYQDIKCGRGEWTAMTLEDAKQMAIDFAKGVS